MFKDRRDAGRQLSAKLSEYRGTDAIVIALPRGGVAVGEVVASELALPLDIIAIRKVGHPTSPEYAIGAIAENGESVWNNTVTATLDEEWLKKESLREQEEAKRRSALYRRGMPPLDVHGRTIILVDDGIATGLTIELAILALRKQVPRKIVAAVPVAPADAIIQFSDKVDELVVLEELDAFEGAVGAHYDEFGQVGDDEVIELLHTSSIFASR